MVDEGFEGRPYKCTENKETIGFGHNLTDRPLTKIQAERILDDDITIAIYDCHKLDYFKLLNKERKSVIVNMMFNLGFSRLNRFVKMAQAIRDKDYEKASEEMMNSRWADQVKDRAIRLSTIMLTGELL